MSHGGRGGKVRSGKLEGRGGQHFSLLEILSSSRRTQWVRTLFEFIFNNTTILQHIFLGHFSNIKHRMAFRKQ